MTNIMRDVFAEAAATRSRYPLVARGDTVCVGTKLPLELKEALAFIARERGWTLSEALRQAAYDYIERREAPA